MVNNSNWNNRNFALFGCDIAQEKIYILGFDRGSLTKVETVAQERLAAEGVVNGKVLALSADLSDWGPLLYEWLSNECGTPQEEVAEVIRTIGRTLREGLEN